MSTASTSVYFRLTHQGDEIYEVEYHQATNPRHLCTALGVSPDDLWVWDASQSNLNLFDDETDVLDFVPGRVYLVFGESVGDTIAHYVLAQDVPTASAVTKTFDVVADADMGVPLDCSVAHVLLDRSHSAWETARVRLRRLQAVEQRLRHGSGWYPSWLANAEKKAFKRTCAKFCLHHFDGESEAVLARLVEDADTGQERYVPVPTTENALAHALYACHCSTAAGNDDGLNKSESRLRHVLYYHGLRPLVNLVVRSCTVCNASKGGRPIKSLRPVICADPMERVYIDFFEMPADVSSMNERFALVAVDHFTKFLWAKALIAREAEEVAAFLISIFDQFGTPKFVHSDNGKELVRSGIVQDVLTAVRFLVANI